MPRKIKLDEPVVNQTVETELSDSNYSESIKKSTCPKDDLLTYSEILKATLAQYPSKMLFSIKDSANALSVSPEFIRKKISDGFIKSVSLGDRKMISINELAKIIYQGV
ncbi:MAG: hypothetical protein ABI638_04375 [Ignavibacteriota bacterium]